MFYLHAPDRATPFAETLEAVDKLHKAGKFVRLGLSNFTAAEVAEVVMICKYNGWVQPTIYRESKYFTLRLRRSVSTLIIDYAHLHPWIERNRN